MKSAPGRWRRLGLRREFSILLPVALLLFVVLSFFALGVFRTGVLRLIDERQQEALRLARDLAEQLAYRALDPAGLASLAPLASSVDVLDASGRSATGEPGSGARWVEPPAQAIAFGPSSDTGGEVIAFAPLGPATARRWVRVTLPAEALALQQRNVRNLTLLVVTTDVALALLVLLFLGRFLAPYDSLLASARRAGAVAGPEEDEVAFLLTTFERALSALPTGGNPEITALERTLPASFDRSGVLLLDRDGLVLALNPIGARLLGVEPPAPRRETAASLLAGHPEIAALLAGALRGEPAPERRECRATTADGPVTLGLTLHPLRREDGTHLGALVLFADLTEVHRREEAARLAEGLQQLGELAAGAAHELRNSLATLRGYLDLLHRHDSGRSVDSPAADYWQEIRRETDHLGRVVSDFLTFASPKTARLEAVDLPSLAARVVADPAFALHPPHLMLAPGAPSAHLVGDGQLLGRALHNLVANAVEAAGATPHPEVEVGVDSGPEGPRLWVADRGPGLPPEVRERLFQPFVTGRAQGVGLGLAVAHRIITLHHGELRLQERPDGGTLAEARFPPGRNVTDGNDEAPGSQGPNVANASAAPSAG